ncbi:MAG TPA: gliding motility-associated C-terminal domain-containing protein [Cytophagaceae bacterium]
MNPIKLVVSLLAWLTTTFSIAATFTVTNINDSGPGSFRQAIIDANTNAGTDNINFNIPGTAPFTITLWSALPAITEAVIISGNTQPGWSEGNPVIELNGANAGVGVNGLVIALASGSCTIRGLSIINFSGNGIYSENASGNTIRGNLIGITTNGNAAGNGGNGIYIAAGCNNNIIGGPANADRNIISSNLNGVDINNSSNNRVENNYIGTGKTGNEARGNRNHGLILGNNSNDNQVINNVISANGTVLVPSPASAYDADGNGLNIDLNSLRNIVRGNKIGLGADGTTLLGNKENGVIVVNGSHDNIIGGNGAGYRNYIAGSGNHAIVVYQSNNTDVKNNYIGTDVSGTLNKGNNDSGIIIISSSGTLVGGPNAGDENMFVFSREEQGVRIQQSQNTIVQRNLIGTNASGTANMGNFGGGVYILGEAGGSTGNVIGSDVAGRGNKIAYNGGNGITMFDGNTYDNPIRRNSIYCNALRGIELNGASNEYATFPAPVILPTSTNTMIRGTARAGAIIEVYGTGAECATCSGNPGSKTVQGKNYLGTVTADASGNWSFPFSGNPDTITATASEALSVGTAHSTSEFSACIVCVAPTPAISGPSFICSNSSNVKFYVTTQHPSSTYTWTVTGATSFTTNNDTVYVNVGSNGTVNVQVTEYNSGCSGSANASATIRPTPSVSVSASSTAICPDASTTLTANASGGNGAFTYEWFHNGNPIANSNSDEYTTSTAGTYTVRVTSNGCSVTSAATVINVKNAISVGVNGPSSSLCSGTSTTLTANASGGNGAFTYEWFHNGNPIANSNSDEYTTSTAGSYTVRVTSDGCSATSSVVVVSIKDAISVGVNGPSSSLCSGTSTTLTANASGGNGSYTYEWFHNGNPIANSNSDEYTTSTAGSYTVRVTSDGCSATSSAVVVSVKDAISVGVNGPSSSLCSGTSTTLTANASGGNGTYAYEWFHNGNPIANSNSDEYTTSTAGSYTVRVTSDGCSATSSAVVVSVKDAISVGVNGPSSSLCSGTSTTLTANASGGNGSYTYEWFHNGNPIANSNSDEYTTSTAGSYTVRVTSDGCSITSLPTDIIVNPVPAPAISGILEHCANTNNVVFSTTIDNSGSGSLYTWSATGGVSIVGHSGNQVTVNIGNTGGVLTVSETRLGCTGTAGETITIKQADFTIQGPSDFCAGDSAIFKINAVNTGTYSWTVNGATYTAFGDDSIRVFYGLTSPITISATETGLGCNTSNVKVINAAATATINPASNSYCQGESVTLTASTNPIVAGTTYQWYHNGQLISSSGSTYQASQAGTYYVVAVIPGVCTVKSGDEVITESPKPSAVVAVDQPVHCAGDQATVSITSSNDVATTYTWYKDGALLNGTTGSSFTTTQSGIYSVVATLGSCSDSSAAGAEVTFFSSSPDFTYSVTDCHSDFVQFTNLSTIPSGFENLVHYEWSFGDGNQSTDKAPGHQYDNSDVYTVTLRVTYLTCEDETSKQITFNGSPEVAIAVSSGNAIGCAGSPVTLVAQVQKGSGDFNYTWTPAAATSGSDQITVNPDSSVIYSVTVTDNITGCTISDNIQIERSKPVVEITGDNSLCTNSSLSLSAKVIGRPGIDYTYSYTTHPANAPLHVEASSSVAPVITSTAGGKYLLILTVTSNDALACTATQSLEITVHEPAVVTLSSSADTVCTGTEIVLAADISETSEWLWTAYDETMSEVYFTQSTSEQQLVTKTLAGTVVYQVLARDENGCLVEDTVKVHSVNNQNLVIPNLITPNEDELNDVLIIKDEHNLDILPGASLEIYNRWGHRVYLNNNYQNDWGGEGQSDGMYFFHLQPSCGDKEYKGWIQILGNTQSSGRVFNRN